MVRENGGRRGILEGARTRMRKLRETLMSQTPPIASGVGRVWVGNGVAGRGRER